MSRPTGADRVREGLGWCALGSAALSPFMFGAVERQVWMPLCLAWMAAGLASRLVCLRSGAVDASNRVSGLSRALLPLHALFAVQLLPLPAAALRVVSPGSHAAHFLPDPGDGRFRPLSVSPGATIEAWFYVCALQGLFLAIQGIRSPRRPPALRLIAGCLMLLAAEGLWQSRSDRPFDLYGRFPTDSPQGLETSTYGPYYNRNHFATATGLGAALCAGLAVSAARAAGGLSALIRNRALLPAAILQFGAAGFLALATAASGSRSGALATIAALGVVMLVAFGKRAFLAAIALGSALALIAGPASVERLARLDFAASRWLPWVDMTTLFRFFGGFGAGIGAFGAAYWPYQRNATYEFWQHAHNEYLEWAIEAGLLGLVVLIAVLRGLASSLRIAPADRAIVCGALTVGLVQSFLDFPMRIPANAAVLAAILALATSPRARHA